MRRGIVTALLALALASPAAAAEKARITIIGHGYYAGPLFVAEAEHLFEKHGLEPEITVVQGGSLALQTVLTKQADAGVLSYEHVATAAGQGKRIVAFFGIANRPVNNIVANDKLYAAGKDLGIEAKVKALKGLRVGLPSANGSGEKMLKVLARKYGMALPGDIQTVYLGSEPGSYLAAFQRGLIDAALPVEPAGVLVQQAGAGHIYLDMMNGQVPDFADIQSIALVAHPDLLAEKPEFFRKLAAVFLEAQHILKDEKPRGMAIMGKVFPTLSAEANQAVYATVEPIWTRDGRMTERQARATIAYLEPEGAAQIDVAKTFTNEFLPK